MCNKIWSVCENVRESMKMLEKDHFVQQNRVMCKPVGGNGVAGFSGLKFILFYFSLLILGEVTTNVQLLFTDRVLPQYVCTLLILALDAKFSQY